jgi:DNA ligase-1
MISIFGILTELNEENGSNYKLSVLRKYSDREDLQRILKMTYDTVFYTYGVRKLGPGAPVSFRRHSYDLDAGLDMLEFEIATRKHTGNDALGRIADFLENAEPHVGVLIKQILNRDLRINCGRTTINKVWKGLITKPVYLGCDVYNDKTKKDISFPAMLQLKADGTYREFTVLDGTVSACSRSGEKYSYPTLFEKMKTLPNGVYVGELTVRGITNRAEANGLINSYDVPHDDLILECWDYITLEEYAVAAERNAKNPCKTQYSERLIDLNINFNDVADDQLKVIPSTLVHDLDEAVYLTIGYMKDGFEGAILKDYKGVFKDGKSKHQLKMKVCFECEVEITGFIEGTPGTVREKTFGSMTFSSSDGKVKGSVSGFKNDQLEDFNSRRDEMIGQIMSVQGNDLTIANGSDYYAISHPRFIEIRDDKTTADDIETIEMILESAKLFKG